MSSGQAGRDVSFSRWSLAACSLPAIPIVALGSPFVDYLLPLYAKNLGLDLAIAGPMWPTMTASVHGRRAPSRPATRDHPAYQRTKIYF